MMLGNMVHNELPAPGSALCRALSVVPLLNRIKSLIYRRMGGRAESMVF